MSDLCWFERIHLCYALQNNNYVFSEGALGTLLKNCFQNLLGSFSHSKTTNSSPTLELISNKYTDTNNYVNLTLESQYRSPHSCICSELPQNTKLEGPCSISRTIFQNNFTKQTPGYFDIGLCNYIWPLRSTNWGQGWSLNEPFTKPLSRISIVPIFNISR